MKTFLTLVILLCLVCSTPVLAQQNCEVNGTIVDSLKKSIGNLTVKLYLKNDSLTTVTDGNGFFSFSKISGKEFTINIGGIGYRTLIAQYKIPADAKQIDLGKLMVKGGAIALEDVVIKAKPVAIKYKQDTVEYDAGAFNVQDDDRVTDLLKQLPGVEVDENENVTAMGKSMTKLRVNGQDFFTNNVKDFISKLPAGIVAKIQVIDDFGDRANFTGIKMGTSQKMLNIVTKPGMDKGQFGAISVRGGTNDQLAGKANVNLWNGAKQTSGGLEYSIADNGAGLAQSKNVSLSHSNKINKTSNFGINYGFNGANNNTNTTQAIETVNSFGKLNSQIENTTSSNNQGQNLGLRFNKVDKKIFLSTAASITNNNSTSITNALNYQTGFTKQDFKNNSNNSNRTPSVKTGIEFSKRLEKNSLGGSFSFNSSSNKSTQDIITNTLYYNPSGALEKDSLLNRTVSNNSNNQSFNFGLYYNLSLKQDSVSNKAISINYDGSVTITESDLSTFVLNAMSTVRTKVDSLSVFTKNQVLNHSLSLNYNQYGKKNRLNVGFNVRPNSIRNQYPELNTTINNTYINISPTVGYSKTISQSKNISINYNGYNNNPSISQMQPVKNTQNLQNVIIGNPNLKSSFSHSLSTGFGYHNRKSEISFNGGINMDATQNEIVNNTIIIPDTLGTLKQETHFANVNGGYNINGNYSINIPFKTRKYVINYSGNIGTSKKIAIINNDKSANKGLNFSQNFTASLRIKKINANVRLGYSVTTNNNNAFSQTQPTDQLSYNLIFNTGQSFFRTKSLNSSLSGSLRLKNFTLNINGNYTHNQNDNHDAPANINNKTQVFSFGTSGFVNLFKSYSVNFDTNKRINTGYSLNNVSPLIINIGASKSFLKNKALVCNINVNDLLNEGNNIAQQIVGNSIIESRTNQVKRLVTFGLAYNLSTFGGKLFKLRTE